MFKSIKLSTLRLLAKAALRVAILVKGQDRYLWLLHYLQGSGETLYVPARHMRAILPTLARRWDDARVYDRGTPGFRSHATEEVVWDRVGFWSTTLYEGYGFGERPEMFYLCGCFTYTVKQWVDHLTGHQMVTIVGADHYDWNPTREGEFFTSPTNRWFARLMGALFGKEYFPSSGFPMGNPGVSNRLWSEMTTVGAKAFKTRFEIAVTREEWFSCLDEGAETWSPPQPPQARTTGKAQEGCLELRLKAEPKWVLDLAEAVETASARADQRARQRRTGRKAKTLAESL